MSIPQHFESGRVAGCAKCERIGSSSWPREFAITSDGFVCLPCAMGGGTLDADGKWYPPGWQGCLREASTDQSPKS